MSAHDQHDGDEHDAEDDAEPSFKDEAESAAVTISEWVELDEDEEDDDEFNPDDPVEDDERRDDDDDDDEDDEDEEDEEIDEDEEQALQDDQAMAEQGAEAGLQSSAAAGEAHEAEDDEEDDDEDEDGEEEDGDEEGVGSILESGAGLMSGAAMSQFLSGVMKADGPTVTTVLLKADGSKEELTLDMTPRVDSPGRVLGGKTSFLGRYPALDIILMTRRDNETNQQLRPNQHTLPPPFDGDVVRGDVLLVRMDKHSVPQPFTLAEWQQFVEAGGNVPADSSQSGEKRPEREEADAEEGGEQSGSASSSAGARKKQRKT